MTGSALTADQPRMTSLRIRVYEKETDHSGFGGVMERSSTWKTPRAAEKGATQRTGDASLIVATRGRMEPRALA